MKDEIKEIKIKTIGQLLDFVETEEKAKELIDYITNLQQLYNKSLEDNVRESKRRMELQEEKQKIIHTNIVQKKQLNNKIKKLQQENKRLQTNANSCKQKNNKAIKLIKRSAGYKGICTQPETDTFSRLLEILGDKDNG